MLSYPVLPCPILPCPILCCPILQYLILISTTFAILFILFSLNFIILAMVYQVEETVMGKEMKMKKELKKKLKLFLSETRESVEVRIYFFFIDMKISDINLCCIFHFLSFFQLNLQTDYIHTCIHTYEQITFTRACTCTYIRTETRIQRRKSVSTMNNITSLHHLRTHAYNR